MVDVEGFSTNLEGECGGSGDRSRGGQPRMNTEAGSKFFNRRTSPPEVTAVKTFLSTHRVDSVLTLEANGVFVRIPWDGERREGSKETDADDGSLRFLAGEYLKAHPSMGNGSAANSAAACSGGGDGGRSGDRPTGIVYGSTLGGEYSGTLLDYVRLTLGVPAVAAHLGCCDFPNRHELPRLWRENMDSLLAFIEASTQGVYGQARTRFDQAMTHPQIKKTLPTQVTDIKGKALVAATGVLSGGKKIRVDPAKASFGLILPEGK